MTSQYNFLNSLYYQNLSSIGKNILCHVIKNQHFFYSFLYLKLYLICPWDLNFN